MEPEIATDRWPRVLDLLKDNIGEKDFGKWIKPIRLRSATDGNFTLEAPNTFIRNWVQTYYDSTLRQSISTIYETNPIDLSFVLPEIDLADTLANVPFSNSPAPETKRETETKKERGLNPHYSFDTFIVGGSNQFAHAVSSAVADAPGTSYNPLFIYGGVGLGKTHLLHAIGLKILQRNPQARLCYLTSERFINDLINSLRLKKMDDFRRRYRSCDVLLIDDIQFLAGKERSQEEFFHTFNTLYELKRQIVLTSDKAPKEIAGLEERLLSRFEWGLIADIQPPELETRVSILNKKAEAHQINLPDEVALFIAGSIRNNIRELEGSLVRLSAYASLMGKEVTLEFAQEVFKDLIKPPQQITVDQIQKAVAKAYNIKPQDLCSARKFKYIAHPRQIAMYLARKLTNASFPDIGNKFGGKDHTTVLHAVKKIEVQIPEDNSLKNTIESLEKTIRFGSA